MPRGIVKRWDDDRGFGFIEPEGGGPDIFVHRKVFGPGSNRDCYLEKGDRVEFEAKFDDQKGKEVATSCRGWREGGGGGGGGRGRSPRRSPPRGRSRSRSPGRGGPPGGYGMPPMGYGMPPPGYPGYGMPPYGMPPPGYPGFPGGPPPGYPGGPPPGYPGGPGGPPPGYPGYPGGYPGPGGPGGPPGGPPPGPGGAPGLPPGWEQITDPASGRPYFCNRSTGETSWTPPAALGGAPAPGGPPGAYVGGPAPGGPGGPPPNGGPLGGAPLPQGWEQASDPSSGKPYYFNRATGETRWEPPR